MISRCLGIHIQGKQIPTIHKYLLTHCLARYNMIALVNKQELWCFLKVFQHYIISAYIFVKFKNLRLLWFCRKYNVLFFGQNRRKKEWVLCTYKNDWICSAGKALVLCLHWSGKRVCSVYYVPKYAVLASWLKVIYEQWKTR